MSADRKNHLVWDQLELGAYKQALQLCNRRLKKGEKSEMLLALKAFVLTHITTPGTTEEALKITQSLCDRTPPTLSVDVLRLLSRVWSNLGPPHTDEVTKTWERAVKAQPQNEDLAREWFWGTIKAMDWRGAQKAAMNLQKTYMKRREYWFWAVVASLLLHNSLPADSPERKLFGTLAYRMIDKARSDTPVDTNVIPARAIQTSQEVNLLLELLPYVAPGDPNRESLEVLNSKNLGVDSTVGGGDWWGLARKRLDLFENIKDWKSLFETCKKLLPKPENSAKANGEDGNHQKDDQNGDETDNSKKDQKPDGVQGRGDDWRVWDGFVLAAGKLYDDGDKTVAKESLEKILEHRKALSTGSSRHGDLALVKFSSLFHDKNDGPEGTPTLLEAVEEYFVNTSNKSCCFEDIQIYLEMLEDSEKKDFLKYAEGAVEKLPEENEKQQIDKVASSINYQKFVYLLTISPLSTASSTTTKTITTFITGTLELYLSALSLGSSLLVTDNQYGDDAALLSVMGLVRLHTLSPSNQAPLYQSIQILETILQKSKHNYQALLLLVRIYVLIGAIGFALDVYPRLNIKQIQNDTLSHFLLTRISTLLPNDARTFTFLRDAGGIYESSRTQTPNMLQLAFERGGYAQMVGFLDFSERVAGSVCRTMYEVELRRLARLSPGYPDPGLVTEVGCKGAIWDNRDFSVVVNCELSSVGSFEQSFRPGPTPGENWVRAFAAAEEITSFLTSYVTAGKESNGTLTITSGENPKLADDVAGRIVSALQAGERAGEYTQGEKTHLLLISAIGELAAAALKKDGETVKTALKAIMDELLPKTLEVSSPNNPDWSLIHALWILKDATAVSELLVSFLSATKGLKPGVSKSTISELDEAAKKGIAEVLKKAEQAQKVLEDEDQVQALVDVVLAEEGVGGVFRREGVFGGVERVAERVRKARGGIVTCFKSM